jgi:hypothetical protein
MHMKAKIELRKTNAAYNVINSELKCIVTKECFWMEEKGREEKEKRKEKREKRKEKREKRKEKRENRK